MNDRANQPPNGPSKRTAAAAALALACLTASAQPSVELLHWWTSPGETLALRILRDHAKLAGVELVDTAIVGGGGDAAMRTLRARVAGHKAPTAVQLLGNEMQDWGRLGALADIDALAKQEGWDRLVPKELQPFSKFAGRWTAVPVDVHSTNWVWANREVLRQSGVPEAPATWEQFIDAARKIQAAGYVPLAFGGQDWQAAILFDGVLLSTGGADFYGRLFAGREPADVAGRTLEQAFSRMGELRPFVDAHTPDRPWNLATAMVINGRAGFQVMGDWAKAEFAAAGKAPGTDYLCFRVPGTKGSVLFSVDNFAMFRVDGAARIQGQQIFAKAMMEPAFQAAFNEAKGAVPPRSDVPADSFDECGRTAIRDLADAGRHRGHLLGSLALGHATSLRQKDALNRIVARHFAGELGDRDAAREFLAVLRQREANAAAAR